MIAAKAIPHAMIVLILLFPSALEGLEWLPVCRVSVVGYAITTYEIRPEPVRFFPVFRRHRYEFIFRKELTWSYPPPKNYAAVFAVKKDLGAIFRSCFNRLPAHGFKTL